ncbi:MAG: M24 family metallopeptidase [Chloroflexota bacterium]
MTNSNLRPDYQGRTDLLTAALLRERYPAFITVNPSDIEYLTGLGSSPSCLVVTPREQPALFVDEARWNGAADARPHARMHRYGAADNLAHLVESYCIERALESLACEDLPLSLVDNLARAGRLSVRRNPGMLSGLRRPKDGYEQDNLRQAARLADESMVVAKATIRPGVTELQVAAEIDRLIKVRGGDGTWFPTVVSSGIRAAHPVYPATRKVIEVGDMVVVDIGTKWDGYCADLTRTFIVGGAERDKMRVLEAVLEAQRQALAVVHAGVTVAAVDQAARNAFADQGYSGYETHPIGHGLGLAKEPPTLAIGVEGALVAGECVTVEPGIYLPGFGGARIEDDVLVLPDGAEVITQASKTLDFLVVG